MIGALIIDDDARSIESIQSGLMRAGLGQPSLASNVGQALGALELRPHTVVVEVMLAFARSGAVLDALARQGASTRIVATSGQASLSQVFELNRFGVDKFLEKPLTACAVAAAVQSSGRVEPATGRVIATSAAEQLARLGEAAGLTPAEQAVLGCALLRMSQDEIADARCVSLNTVKSQVKALLGKLGADRLSDLVSRLQQPPSPRSPARFSLHLEGATLRPNI